MAIQGKTGFAVATTLNTALSASALTAYTVDKKDWPDGSNDRFVIQIGSEYLLISRRDGNTLTIAQRGYNGTTAAIHAAAAAVTVLGYETIRTAFDAVGFLALASNAQSSGAVVATSITNTGVDASAGVDTSSGTAVTAPTVSSGVAFTPSTTKNAQVTFQFAAATGSYTLTYGPTTGAENALATAAATLLNEASVISFMVPKGWKVVLTLTTVTLAATLVTTF